MNYEHDQVLEDGRRMRWDGERIARLGFLVGLGWSAKRISDDPIIASTPNNVHRQVQRFGLSFIAARVALAMQLPSDAAAFFELAAVKRGLTLEAMVRKLLIEVAKESALLDNILDDGV